MTQEQILAKKFLSQEEKERVVAAFTACKKTGTVCTLEKANSDKDIKELVAVLVANYNKRKEAQQRKQEKKAMSNEKMIALANIVNDAAKYGYTIDDIAQLVTNAIKEKKNAEILAKIQELQAQLI